MIKSSLVGKNGEDMALSFLRQNGYQILRRNYRFSRGEIDLIMRKHDTIIFVEVKGWNSLTFEDLSTVVDKNKVKKIIYGTRHFLYNNSKYNDMDVRFDLVFVDFKHSLIEHVIDAFTENSAA